MESKLPGYELGMIILLGMSEDNINIFKTGGSSDMTAGKAAGITAGVFISLTILITIYYVFVENVSIN